MAKPVKLAKGKEFTFKSASKGGVSKYMWDEWFNPDPTKFPSGLVMLERDYTDDNGKVHKRDFDVEADAMPPKIKTAARRRYKVVRISRLDADGAKLPDALIICTRDMTAEERLAEDVKRAEEKEAKKAKGEDEAPAPAPTLATGTHG